MVISPIHPNDASKNKGGASGHVSRWAFCLEPPERKHGLDTFTRTIHGQKEEDER